MRGRDAGYTSLAELETAMAPFKRPAAHMPWDLLDTFVVHVFCHGTMNSYRMSLTPSARTKLLSHLRPNSNLADAAVWLAHCRAACRKMEPRKTGSKRDAGDARVDA